MQLLASCLTTAAGSDAVAVGPHRSTSPSSPSIRCRWRSRPGNVQCEQRPDPSIVKILTGSPSQPKRRGVGSSSPASADISSCASVPATLTSCTGEALPQADRTGPRCWHRFCSHRASMTRSAGTSTGNSSTSPGQVANPPNPPACRMRRSALVETGVNQARCTAQTVASGCVQRRHHVTGSPASEACSRYHVHSPSSHGQFSRQRGGAIATSSLGETRSAAASEATSTYATCSANQCGVPASGVCRGASLVTRVARPRPYNCDTRSSAWAPRRPRARRQQRRTINRRT